MCAGPSFPGTVSRKKSPNPTRYIRTRMLPLPAAALACRPAGLATIFEAAFRGTLVLVFTAALAAVLRGALVVFAAAFRRAFGALLRVAMISTPRATGQSWPGSDWDPWCPRPPDLARSQTSAARAHAVATHCR